MKTTNSFRKLFASSFLTVTVFSAAVIADDDDYRKPGYNGGYGQNVGGYQEPAYDPYSAEFRAHYPLKVFVNVKAGRKGRNQKLEYLVIETMASRLPYGVEIVRDPHHADLVIRAHEKDFGADFRVVDVDRKDKKYKKRFRRAAAYSGDCAPYKAHYTRVREKGVGYYDYGVKIRMKGYGKDYTQVGGKVYENYSYGKNLKAQTSCGFQPISVFPSNGVEKLFAKSHPSYRREVIRELRREAACDLGLRLAYIVKARADQYYTDLAYKLAHEPSYHSDNRNYGGHDYARSDGRYKWRR